MIISSGKIKKLANKEYRQSYLKSMVTAWVVHQIKALREARHWTQSDLARVSGKPQSAIGRYESEGYGNWTTNTLLELADAFDVALEVRFVSWPKFLKDTADTGPKAMAVKSFSSADFTLSMSAYERVSSTLGDQTPKQTGRSELGYREYSQPLISPSPQVGFQ